MKAVGVLLVGPFPPPHGGVSVHVRNAQAIVRKAGILCEVLNVEPRAPNSDAYIKISGGVGLFRQLLGHAMAGWTLHVHTNGHNPKSWLIALAGGIAAQFGSAGVLTLHSGLMSSYVESGPAYIRTLVRLASVLHNRVVCVNSEMADTLARLGIPRWQLEVMPAFLPPPREETPVPSFVTDWLANHRPVISTAISFRPEYGFDVLLAALKDLRATYPGIGCLVMGAGEDRTAAEALIHREGLTDAVLLTGDVDHSLCLNLIASSDLFVRATFRDGDAISVREALSVGIPVVASDVGARPAGVLKFEPGNVAELVRCVRRSLDRTDPEAANDVVNESHANSTSKLMALYAF
jgi:glycosyltransferase involved in cell wall biosynthesis